MNTHQKLRFPIYATLACLLAVSGLQAQKFRYSIPSLDSIETFIVSGGSSTILQNGKAEIILNNTLTSNWIAIHESTKNSPILDRYRQTLFSSDLYGYYGISQSARWDIGLHLKYVRSRFDNEATSSMFNVFEAGSKSSSVTPDNPTNSTIILDKSFGGLAGAGIRFRIKPAERVPELVVNGGYTLTTVKDPQEQRQLNADRDIADIGVTYYKDLTKHIFYFFGASAAAYFPSALNDEYLFNTNLYFYIIHRTENRKFTFYPGLAYGLAFKPAQFDQAALIRTIDYLFAYGGVQFAPNANFNVFVTGGFPLSIELKHPQQEIVKNSYSTVSLGIRKGF